MKIAYIGNFVPFWSTENHVRLSLEELGHKVVQCQENELTAGQVLRVTKDEKPDLLLWTRTWGLQGDSLAMLESVGCPTVAFHLDLYAGLERSKTVETEPWWRCNYVFTADGGSPDFWKEHGINHFWSPPGVYGKECYRAEPIKEYESEILFTGSVGYHPEWPIRPLLIDKLKEQYGSRFKLVEHGSPGAPWRGHKLNQLYASSKVVVGDSCNVNPMFGHKFYWSDRVTEVFGRGGMLIHPYVYGIEKVYEPDKEILTYQYGNWMDLYFKIDWLLANPDEREAMRLRAFERTKKEHTYVHRLKNVLDVVDGKKNIWETS